MSTEPLHILLVRHGQTDANRDGVVQGHKPTSLNGLGRRQALMVAQRLAAFRPAIELLVSSDLLRAAQTAGPIADALGLPIRFEPAWRERTYGSFEGKDAAERAILRQQLRLDPTADPPGAQCEAEYQSGIREALSRLPHIDPRARCIAVVTHYGPCRAVTMMMADGRLPAAPECPVPADFACPNGGITHLVLERTPAGAVYRYGFIYDVEHLLPVGVTTADAG